jgi:hypothetical protein
MVFIVLQTYCWGPSSSEGPQKMTNMFSKYNICTGTFEHRMELYMIWKSVDPEKVEPGPKLPVERLRLSGGK